MSEEGHDSFAVEVRDLNKHFGHVSAVKDFSFGVRRGEFLSLLGPSGCGKTTTLRMIAGLEHPSAGDILIKGERVNDWPPYMRNIGLVFQDYALFPHKTIYNNVAFGLKYRHVPKDVIRRKVQEYLELVRLPGVENRYPSQLSGGQQQRIALARALVIEPDLLLLDEPLSNLDAKLRAEMRVELKRIQREVQITTIFVTHDQEEALTLSTNIIVMKDGVGIQEGVPTEIYEQPNSEFVADFIGHSNFMQGMADSYSADEILVTTDSGLSFRAKARPGIAVRDPVTLVVRSERVAVSARKPDANVNVFPGVVEVLTYLGGHANYYVRLESGDLVHSVDILRENPIPENSRVWVRLEPQHCVLLKRSREPGDEH